MSRARVLRFSIATLALLGCSADPEPAPVSSPSPASTVPGGSGEPTTSGPAPPADAPGAGGSTPAIPPGKIPIFIAQGTMGRTVISCDDGKTWVGDQSWASTGDPLMCGVKQNLRCGQGMCSYLNGSQCVQKECCNDTADIPEGVAFNAGVFAGTWGHGSPGAIRMTKNGVDWTTTRPGAQFGGIAYGGGRFVAASRFPQWSVDGVTWTAGGQADFRNANGTKMGSPVRGFRYGEYQGGGRFVAIAAGAGNRDMLVSSDGGDTWWRPSNLPDNCAQGVNGSGGDILAGNGIFVVVDQSGTACRSLDGGQTWTSTPTGFSQVNSLGVWTGTEFVLWGDAGFMSTSPDGAVWTKKPMATPMDIGPVARAANGTFVALATRFNGYEKQQFYRSIDGSSWEALPAAAFTQSHSIFYITTGWGDPSGTCKP